MSGGAFQGKNHSLNILLFCNRFNTLGANVPGFLQTKLAGLSNEQSLSLVEHVEDKAVQLKIFLYFLHFWSLSRKHLAGLSNLLFSFPEGYFEENFTLSKRYIFIVFPDFEWKTIGVLVEKSILRA